VRFLIKFKGESMAPRREYYTYVLGALAVSLFFLVIGVYMIVSSIGQENSSRLFYGGAGCTGAGLLIMWREVIRWVRPVKTTFQNTVEVCPFCGALTGKDATFCEKCKRQLSN